MVELFSIDVHYAVQELQMVLQAKIEKAYQGERHDVLLHLYCSDGKKRNIRFLPGLICMPMDKPSYPQTPPGFAMFLRKRICGSRITAVEQMSFDRIIRFTCEYKGSPPLYLVFELMAPGNILLLDENSMIINLLEQHQYKDRAVKARQVYAYPPAPYPIDTITIEELARHIEASTKESIVKTLAMHCGIGGVYAEEACARSNIAKHRNDLTQEETLKIAKNVYELLHQPLNPVQDDQRIYPFKLITKDATPCQSTFLTSLASLVHDEISVTEKKKASKTSPTSKLDKLIEAQSAQLRQLETSAAEDQQKGEWLYTHYMDVSKLLDVVKNAREKKQSIKEAIAQFKKISYNDKTFELTIDIPEEITADDKTADTKIADTKMVDSKTSEDKNKNLKVQDA